MNGEKTEMSTANYTASYIKEKLGARILETSLIPQENGEQIVIEKCIVDGDYKVLIVYETGDNDKCVIGSFA